MGAQRPQHLPQSLRRMLTISMFAAVLAGPAAPVHAGADESCLARVSKDGCKDRSLFVELEDGRRLELRHWNVRKNPEAGIDTSGFAFETDTPLVPARSIRAIDYRKRGTNFGGLVGGLAGVAAGIALSRPDHSDDPQPKDPLEAIGQGVGESMNDAMSGLLGGLLGGLVGYLVGTAVFPPRSEPHSIECAPGLGEIAHHDASFAPALSDSASSAAGSRP